MKYLILAVVFVLSLACGGGGESASSSVVTEDVQVQSVNSKANVDILFFIHNEDDPVAPYDGEIYVIHNRSASNIIPSGSELRLWGDSDGVTGDDSRNPDFDISLQISDNILPGDNLVWRTAPLGDSNHRWDAWLTISGFDEVDVVERRGIDPDDNLKLRTPWWGNTYNTWPEWYTYDGNSQ